MEIKYQAILNNNPIIRPTTGELAGSSYPFTLERLTIEEIIDLEIKYNNGNQFPASLRELLFLAGKDCYVLDYGLHDTQEEMQDDVRNWLIKQNLSIKSPFFVIDVHRGPEIFLFVYLDEGVPDPIVYQGVTSYYDVGYSWPMKLESTLSSFIDNRISDLKLGKSPF